MLPAPSVYHLVKPVFCHFIELVFHYYSRLDLPNANLWDLQGGLIQAGCPSYRPANNVKALKGSFRIQQINVMYLWCRFEALLEREWLQAGHPFGDRCEKSAFANSKLRQESPVFLLFLDCAWQVWHDYHTDFDHAVASCKLWYGSKTDYDANDDDCTYDWLHWCWLLVLKGW